MHHFLLQVEERSRPMCMSIPGTYMEKGASSEKITGNAEQFESRNGDKTAVSGVPFTDFEVSTAGILIMFVSLVKICSTFYTSAFLLDI